MNRLSTIRSFSQKNNWETQNTFSPALGPFLRRNLKTSKPVSISFGRGYGLGTRLSHNILLPDLVSLSLIREMAVGKPRTKEEEKITEDNFKPKNFTTRKLGETLEEISQDLVQLSEKEIQTLMDNDANSIQTERGKTWLEQSQYALRPVPNDIEKLMLTKKTGNTTVTVTFKKTYEEVEQAEESASGEESTHFEADSERSEVDQKATISNEEENEGQESWIRSGDELPDRENFPQKHSLEIDIRLTDKIGNPKGILHIYGFAGLDDRLYVNEMLCDSDIKADTNLEKKSYINFDDLSDPMQDRIYDYLDELGVDDRMSHFIKTTVAREKTESDISFLTNFRDILNQRS